MASNITLKNHAAAEVTYKVMSVAPELVVWADDTQGSLLGFRTASLQRKLPTDKANGVIRVQGKVSRPVLDATTGALSYSSLGTFEFVFPAKASLAERREIRAALADFCIDATVVAAVETFEMPT